MNTLRGSRHGAPGPRLDVPGLRPPVIGSAPARLDCSMPALPAQGVAVEALISNPEEMPMSDQEIEKEIQEKGLTAPRVTPQRIEDVIVSEHYFTAADGRAGAIAAETYEGRELPSTDDRDLAPLGLLTFCVLILRNGFTVTGESPDPAQRVHRHRRKRLRQPGELRRGAGAQDRAQERSGQNLGAGRLRASGATGVPGPSLPGEHYALISAHRLFWRIS